MAGPARALGLTPRARILATALTKLSSKDNRVVFKSEVRLYDVATGALTQTLSVRTEAISSLAFSLNGKQLLIGGLQLKEEKPIETLELSDIQTGSLGSVHAGDEGSVRSVTLSPNGRALAVQSNASKVDLLDTLTWKIAHTFDEKSDGDASPRPTSPDAKNNGGTTPKATTGASPSGTSTSHPHSSLALSYWSAVTPSQSIRI
jgi:WD40 repeat protein